MSAGVYCAGGCGTIVAPAAAGGPEGEISSWYCAVCYARESGSHPGSVEVENLDDAAASIYGDFLAAVLEPWTRIEGAETGDTMADVLRAGRSAKNYLGLPGLKVLLALDEAVREMVASVWFVEMVEEERPPYDYYAQGMAEARAAFEPARHAAIARCRQFGGNYGGEQAERMIAAYEPI